MAEDALDHVAVVDQGHDAHFFLALRAEKWVRFPHRLDELAPLGRGDAAGLMLRHIDDDDGLARGFGLFGGALIALATHLIRIPAVVAHELETLVRDVLGDGGDKVAGGEDLEVSDQLAWIGMVLVDANFRGMKIATRLMHRALEYLNGTKTVKLDATPAGCEVYGQLGFQEEWGLSRMTTTEVISAGKDPIGASLLQSIDVVSALDIEAFGVNRRPILTSLLERTPSLAWSCVEDGEVSAFCFGRPGTYYSQIGPVVARDEKSARQVIVAALHQLRGQPAVIDVPDCHDHILGLLAQHGFSKERPFTRMFKGTNSVAGHPELVFASAGPELG